MTSRRTRVRTTTTYYAPHSTVGDGAQGDGLYLSRSDIQYSIDAFRAVLRTATAYREQLEKTSHDASNFALALEQLARTDLGSDGVGAGLQACAGFHNLISNQNHVLGDILYKTFERPLEEHCSDYEAKLKSDEIEYEQTVAVLGESIRRTEARSFNLGRRGERDLNTFRSAIADLTQQVDDLEAVKAAYYEGLRDTRALSLSLVLHTASEVVRAEVDVYEKIASKGITDPILQGMISSVPDPFESYPTSSSSEIFSILPPLLSNGFGNDHLKPHQSNSANQPEIYRISEAATVVDGDDVDGERLQSEFSNGGDSFKHDSGTVNAFAALFGATINEVWAGQEDDEDEEEDNGNGNEDCNGNEQVQEEEMVQEGEEVQEEEVQGEEGVPGEEEAQGDKGEAEKYDDRDEEVNGDKEDEDYKFEEAQEVNDEDEVEEPDRTAGDGSGKSEALYEVDHTGSGIPVTSSI